MPVAADPNERQKALGAFYTPRPMAAKLVEWAIRAGSDRIVDPSLGGSVFLDLAKERLNALGNGPRDLPARVYGIDLDEDAIRAARDVRGLDDVTLIHSDFFELEPEALPRFSANVGNPPYVRYQRWATRASRAHAIAAEMGVRLTKLSSLWAPFLLHGTRFLDEGGRLAQVLPAELLYAQYATPVLDHLARSFRVVSIAVFEERVFPGALEEIVLLFADGYSEGPAPGVRVVPAQNVADLDLVRIDEPAAGYITPRLPLLSLLSPASQSLYRRLAGRGGVSALGDLASVDVGAVTGGNDFFLRTRTEIERRGFAPELFATAVSKASDVPGARLCAADLDALAEGGRPTELLATNGHEPAALASVAALLAEGEARRLPQRYKCRIRQRWWSVPLPKRGIPDAFLTYMSSTVPRLVRNEARAVSTNTLHNVSVAPGVSIAALSASFYNSLTLLSAELVGRSYGGGILKLEPSEAERLLVPSPPPGIGRLLPRIDRLLRRGRLDAVLDLVDPLALGPLGLLPTDIALLRKARERLLARRLGRSRRRQPP